MQFTFSCERSFDTKGKHGRKRKSLAKVSSCIIGICTHRQSSVYLWNYRLGPLDLIYLRFTALISLGNALLAVCTYQGEFYIRQVLRVLCRSVTGSDVLVCDYLGLRIGCLQDAPDDLDLASALDQTEYRLYDDRNAIEFNLDGIDRHDAGIALLGHGCE